MTPRADQGLSTLLQSAINLDKRGAKKEASRRYLKASKILVKLSKSTTLPSVRHHYVNRAEECIDRVRYIFGIKKRTQGRVEGLKTPPSNINDSSIGSNPKLNDSLRTEIDEETKRLQDMIADTVITEKPKVNISEVAGLGAAKQVIHDAIVAPIRHPELFKAKARQPWKGILLYGPAGCGKTLIAKAIASEVKATFFNVSAANIVSKWLGESEKLMKTLFEMARRNQPSIIFLDELDSIGGSRSSDDVGGERRLKTQLLTELQGLTSGSDDRVTTIGATNLPWELDFALRSRFEKKILVPLPDIETRAKIFEIHVNGIAVFRDVNFHELARLTDNYSGRDISIVCREAAMEPIRELQRSGRLDEEGEIFRVRPISRDDFLHAIENIAPSTSPNEMKKYYDWGGGF